jgi:hypothetical protein
MEADKKKQTIITIFCIFKWNLRDRMYDLSLVSSVFIEADHYVLFFMAFAWHEIVESCVPFMVSPITPHGYILLCVNCKIVKK